MGLASKSITDICFSTIVFKCKPNSLIKMKKMCIFPYINEMAKVGKQEELWDLTNQQHPNSSPSVTCIRGHGRAPEEEGTVSAQRVPAIYHRSDFYARSLQCFLTPGIPTGYKFLTTSYILQCLLQKQKA